MLNQIDRYLLRNLAIAMLAVSGALSAVIWLTQSLRLVELVVEGGAGIGDFLRLALLAFPTFLSLVLPFGLLVATLFTYNRMMVDSEMVVMRAAGLGPMSLARPVLILATATSLLCFALTLYLGPAAQRHLAGLRQSVRSEFSAALLREGAFNEIGDKLTVYVRDRTQDGTLHDLLIHDARQEGVITTVVAARGTLTDADGQPRVLVFDGTQSRFMPASGKSEWLEFERYAVDLMSLRRNLSPRWVEPRERDLTQLLNPTDDPMDQRYAGRIRAELHNRLASPFLALSFAIIALAALLPGEFSRRGRARQIATAGLAALLLQSAVLGVTNLIGKVPAMALPLYILVLAPIPLGIWYLRRGLRAPARPTSLVGS